MTMMNMDMVTTRVGISITITIHTITGLVTRTNIQITTTTIIRTYTTTHGEATTVAMEAMGLIMGTETIIDTREDHSHMGGFMADVIASMVLEEDTMMATNTDIVGIVMIKNITTAIHIIMGLLTRTEITITMMTIIQTNIKTARCTLRTFCETPDCRYLIFKFFMYICNTINISV